MKERPILFSGEMVRALLDGRKTQTRRIVKPGQTKCPYGEPGDRLWVRETWGRLPSGKVVHAEGLCTDEHFDGPWKPSIHLRKIDARIWLEVTREAKQRLRTIDDRQALMEGMCVPAGWSPREEFSILWDTLHTKPGRRWEDNPYVWVVTFKVLSTTGRPDG